MALQDESTRKDHAYPWRESLTAALVAGVLALAYVLWPPSSVTAWVLLVVYASGVALATWVLLVGLEAGRVALVVSSGFSLAVLPVIARLDFIDSVLIQVGQTPDRPFGLTWIWLGETDVSTLALAGMVLSAVAALASAILARRARGMPDGPVLTPRSLPTSLLAGLAGFALVVRDIGFLAIPVGFAAGVGVAAILVGKRAGWTWLVASGWLSFASIPSLHAFAIMLQIGGGWAPTILFDLVGVGVAGIATVVSAFGIWLLQARKEGVRHEQSAHL